MAKERAPPPPPHFVVKSETETENKKDCSAKHFQKYVKYAARHVCLPNTPPSPLPSPCSSFLSAHGDIALALMLPVRRGGSVRFLGERRGAADELALRAVQGLR